MNQFNITLSIDPDTPKSVLGVLEGWLSTGHPTKLNVNRRTKNANSINSHGSFEVIECNLFRHVEVGSQDVARCRSADACSQDAYRHAADTLPRFVKPVCGLNLRQNGIREAYRTHPVRHSRGPRGFGLRVPQNLNRIGITD